MTSPVAGVIFPCKAARLDVSAGKRAMGNSAGGGACNHGNPLKQDLASAKGPCETSRMSRELANEICSHLPGAERGDPDGSGKDCWYLGKNLFARVEAGGQSISILLPAGKSAEILIETGCAEPAPDLEGDWVDLPLDCAPDELSHRIIQSWKRVRAGQPCALSADSHQTEGAHLTP